MYAPRASRHEPSSTTHELRVRELRASSTEQRVETPEAHARASKAAPRSVAHAALAVDARRRLARRIEHARPRASVDGEGARVAREGPRGAPRGAHGARRRVRLAARRTRDARFVVDGACRVPRRAWPRPMQRRVDGGGVGTVRYAWRQDL